MKIEDIYYEFISIENKLNDSIERLLVLYGKLGKDSGRSIVQSTKREVEYWQKKLDEYKSKEVKILD